MKKIIQWMLATMIVVAWPCVVRAGSGSWTNSTSGSIPDNQPDSGLLSSITISAGDSQLTGYTDPIISQLASIQLNISGGWNGDYIFTLYHILPDNTTIRSVILLDRIGVDGTHPDGFENGGMTITLQSGQPDIHLFGGSYTDSSPLTGTYGLDGGGNFDSFINDTVLGTWSLYLTDNSPGYVGELDSWAVNLQIQSVPEPGPGALAAISGLFFFVCWRIKARGTRK